MYLEMDFSNDIEDFSFMIHGSDHVHLVNVNRQGDL